MSMIRCQKGFRFLLLSLAVGVGPMLANAEETVLGAPAPNLMLSFADGGSAELGDWLGKQPVYLKMWATWCSTCRAEMPHYQALYQQYGQDIAFFSVNAGFNDTLADVAAFNAKYGLDMPSVIDTTGQIGQAFNLIATPHNILIDSEGSVVYLGPTASGRVDALLADLSRAQSVAGVDVRPARAQPPAEERVPLEGDPAPPFTIETLDGANFSADGSDAAEPTWLLFFATWCESYMAGDGEDREAAEDCRATRAAVDAAFAGMEDRPRLIGIASRMFTGRLDLEQYRDEFKPAYPLALDASNEVFQRYGVRQFPTLIAIADGHIQRRIAGAVKVFPSQ